MAGLRRLAAVAACAVLVGALASGAGGTVPSNAGNRRLAQLDAGALLARLQLPAGAASSATEPAGDGGLLGRPALGFNGNVVDEHQWWVVSEGDVAVDSFLRHHLPVGSKLTFSGSEGKKGRPPGQLVEGFAWPALRGRLTTRELIVALSPLTGGGTGVRVDAVAVWITPRPASERIPPRAARLEVQLRRFSETVAGPFTFTARRPIRRVRGLINALPAAQPGVQACPNDAGYDVLLTFSGADGRTLAVVDADPQGCGGVQLTLSGRPQPPLTSEAFPGSGRSARRFLIGQLDRALGLHLAAMLTP